MSREPVLVILNGLAAVVGLVLAALVKVDVLQLDAGQVVAITAAVAGVCNLVGLAIRSTVTSPATMARYVALTLPQPDPNTRTTPPAPAPWAGNVSQPPGTL